MGAQVKHAANNDMPMVMGDALQGHMAMLNAHLFYYKKTVKRLFWLLPDEMRNINTTLDTTGRTVSRFELALIFENETNKYFIYIYLNW